MPFIQRSPEAGIHGPDSKAKENANANSPLPLRGKPKMRVQEDHQPSVHPERSEAGSLPDLPRSEVPRLTKSKDPGWPKTQSAQPNPSPFILSEVRRGAFQTCPRQNPIPPNPSPFILSEVRRGAPDLPTPEPHPTQSLSVHPERSEAGSLPGLPRSEVSHVSRSRRTPDAQDSERPTQSLSVHPERSEAGSLPALSAPRLTKSKDERRGMTTPHPQSYPPFSQ